MYCAKCGNTGYLLDGTPCDCRTRPEYLFSGTECLEVPESYRGIKFSESLLPSFMGDAYAKSMSEIYDSIVSLRWRYKNAIICSPPQTGKAVLAYACIQELFRRGMTVFPIYDVLECKRILLDMDYGRSQLLEVENPTNIYKAEYMFVNIPAITNYDVYDTIMVLLDRRVRRGLSTVFMYEGTWDQFIHNDVKGNVKNSKGTGSRITLEVYSWRRKDEV